MSAEAEVSEALNKPVDQNAQASDEAKKMLEELSGEGATNGTSASKSEPAEKEANGTTEEKNHKSDDKRGRSPDYRRGGRGDRGDRGDRGGWRGRGRGRGRGGYDNRNNIKSDLTTQEESDDPVAIRKQVCALTV